MALRAWSQTGPLLGVSQQHSNYLCFAQTVAPEDMDDLAGCILAHSMGLGKTLQTISFLILFHARKPGTRSLVVTPANVSYVGAWCS